GDARVNGAFPVGTRQVKIALGVGGSTQHMNMLNEPVPGNPASLPRPEKPANRNTEFATAELATNLVEHAGGIDSIALSVAGRYDHYSDFGGHFDPKVGLELNTLQDALRLRASWGTSFRAPPLLYKSRINQVVQELTGPDFSTANPFANFI